MKFEVNVNKKSFLFLSFLLAFLLVGIFAYAYNSSPPNPAVFGHSASEIEGVCRTDGTGCPASASGSNIVGTLVFDVPGKYNVTVPDGVKSVQVQAVGAGGSGGPSYYYAGVSTSAGSGGGSGAYSQSTFSVSPGFIGTVVVGKGGNYTLCSVSWNGGAICADPHRTPSGENSTFTDKNGLVKVKAVGGQGGGAYPTTWAGQCSSGFIGIGGSSTAGVGDVKLNGQDGTHSGGTATPTIGGVNPKFSITGQGGAGSSPNACLRSGIHGAVIIIMYS